MSIRLCGLAPLPLNLKVKGARINIALTYETVLPIFFLTKMEQPFCRSPFQNLWETGLTIDRKEFRKMPESGTTPQPKGKRIARSAGWILTFLLLMPANLLGQMARPLTIDENARLSASASSSYQLKSGLDGGGDVSIAHYGVRVGGAAPLSDRNWLGLSLT